MIINGNSLLEVVRRSYPTRTDLTIMPVKLGVSHDNYRVISHGSTLAYLRIKHITLRSLKDRYFGGITNLERERYTIGLLAGTEFYVPDIIDYGVLQNGSAYMITSPIEGVILRDYLQNRDSPAQFFPIIRDFAKGIASCHRITFEHFGAVGPDGVSRGVSSYRTRFVQFFSRHFSSLAVTEHCSVTELNAIQKYIQNHESHLETNLPPCLVVYDLHPGNVIVNQRGNIAGLFDLENTQAAHPGLESGTLEWTWFGYWGNEHADILRREYYAAYSQFGGPYVMNPQLDKLHLLNHYLSAVDFCYGINDTLSKQFARYAVRLAQTNSIDLTRLY